MSSVTARLVAPGASKRKGTGLTVGQCDGGLADVRFTRTITEAVRAELESLSSWLGFGAVDLAS